MRLTPTKLLLSAIIILVAILGFAVKVLAAETYEVDGKKGSAYKVKGITYITDEDGNLKGWVQPTTKKSSTVFDRDGQYVGQTSESASTIPPIPSIPSIPAIPR